MSFSEFRSRHVICFLAGRDEFAALFRSLQSAIDSFAPEFEIDRQYSQDMPDDHMPRSFDVCWDRVHDEAWTEYDERAVLEHGGVIYVLGPHMRAEDAVDTSAIALRLVAHALANGAVAAKGESAGVAHGVERWTQLAIEAENTAERGELTRICRLAFSKRPLSHEDFLFSIGFHLVGLPEVFVPRSHSDNELVLSWLIDRIADEMSAEGVGPVLARHNATLLPCDGYEEDDFKFNPYGIVYLGDAA
ncbi:hypothetical protein KX729_19635 [Rhizobium sp. XQZ8]|uniref:hypothetical protein n=1 Tax=Rhizobium populisoli TaxID=2859785 RepID=UPI001CA4A229|nr:hypothetical protein [Rhizobium populisoli]MBW6423674.1 hypothetical protein [Rhizobium populisoli]